MKRIVLALAGIGTLSVCVFASGHSSAAAAQTAPAKPAAASTGGTPAPIAPAPAHTVARTRTATSTADAAAIVEAQNLLVKQYCSGCHSEKGKAGGVSLAGFDAAKATDNVIVAEKMIHKLRAGMMPPPNARRPDEAALTALVESLETRIDRAAALHPNPGSRSFQRLNRVEYAQAVKDLLAIDVDVNAYLPPDTISQGFDNVADSQALSATLLEGYLRAAGKVTALAVGDPDAESAEAHYRVPKTSSQLTRVDGAPLGTRGGISVIHTFPADGDYVYRVDLHGNADGFLFGGPAAGEQLEISINGERKALLDIDPKMAEVTTSLSLRTPPIHVAAGPQRVTAAFIQHFEGPVNDLVAPVDHTLADTQIGVAYGVTTLPHLKDLSIIGPQRVTGISDTPSRRKIFTCRPTNEREEETCAVQIVKTLSTQAFRRPPTARDIQGLMRFYADGRKEGNFETGISSAIEAMLASPQFVFRIEETRPAVLNARAGAPARVGDFELASRLSFFLWGTGPDADLLKAAEQGRLSAPGGVDREVKRMLADPRASALSTRFAAQWLRLNDVEGMLPDAVLYPYFDHTLGEAFVKETELFFDSIVREDRSVLDLVTADYSYINERIARHYGIPGVSGPEFRRVTVPDERRGLFGKGSILVLTSVADRTSPVMRGKWVMEVMLDSPPPPPPPNVPLLEATSASAGGKRLSVRERMEDHRKSPACQSCHRVIDPIGLSLEVFDVTGKLRTKDNEVPVDAAGVMYEGTKVNGPAGLRAAMLKHQDIFLQTFTKNLMVYGLGRRVEATDMPTIRAIVKRAAATDNHFSSFVLGIVDSAAFQKRAVEVAETTTASRP
jgi:mono/diheme cytochrome c family protein